MFFVVVDYFSGGIGLLSICSIIDILLAPKYIMIDVLTSFVSGFLKNRY